MHDGGQLDAGRIDLDFTPLPRSGLVTWPIEGESVIVDPASGEATVLNAFASMLWGCLDGRSTLGDLVSDFAYAFDTSAEAVADHVLAFGRAIGQAGLLDNVAATAPAGTGPLGLTPGAKLLPFEATGIDGVSIRLPGWPGRKALIVNWNPSCGYCVSLAPTLAALSPTLERRGVEIVLIASGGAEDNRDLLGAHDLVATTVLRPAEDVDFDDPFPDLGTPVGYLVDDAGEVLAGLAGGAVEVAELARLAAGESEGFPAAAAQAGTDQPPRYLSRAPVSRMCRPGAGGRPARSWQPTATYDIDGIWIGVRADSAACDALIGRLLAGHRVETSETPPVHLSVVISPGAGGRGALNLLLLGDETVVRSRSPRRVVRGLATYLSILAAEENGAPAPSGTLAVSALPIIHQNMAVLAPEVLRAELAVAQPRLTQAGFQVVDMPLALIDPATAELVVPEPRVAINESVLEGLSDPTISRSEAPWVPPGRYPLTAWALGPTPNREVEFTMASVVATAWSACATPPKPPETTLAQLSQLFRHIAALPVSESGAAEIIDHLVGRVANRTLLPPTESTGLHSTE